MVKANLSDANQIYHRDNINNVVEYHNNDAINSLRRIASYLAKEDQKYGLPIWGYNEISHARQGRPRKFS
jgi:hypothetical protein